MFLDRKHAGERLAQALRAFRDEKVVILALPRGGVPVGYEIAKFFKKPFDILIVRKVGAPGHKEFGIGAVAERNVEFLDYNTIQNLGIGEGEVEKVLREEKEEIQRRIKKYRSGKSLQDLKNKIVILVDDGLATGVTATAAIKAVKKLHPKKIIAAFPVCARDTVEVLRSKVDSLVCLYTPRDFQSVGQWYKDFRQLGDEDVISILEASKRNIKLNSKNSVSS